MNKEKWILLAFITVIGIGTLVSGCTTQETSEISKTGMVRFISLEGGFYGIISDDNEHYDPLNLDPEFQEDGLRVYFKAKISENQTSIHVWGIVIEIISIEKLEISGVPVFQFSVAVALLDVRPDLNISYNKYTR